MGWADWIDLIAKGASTYFGYKDAKSQEEWQMSPNEAWGLQNPSSTSPLWNVQSDWNSGNPIINKQMTPQLQQAFDEHIWKALAQAPSNYGQSENMDRLQNLSENYQLSRFGKRGTPYSKKPDASNALRYEPIGLGNVGVDDGQNDYDQNDYGDNDWDDGTSGDSTIRDEFDYVRDFNDGGEHDFLNGATDWFTGQGDFGQGGQYGDGYSGIPFREEYGGFGGAGSENDMSLGDHLKTLINKYGDDAASYAGSLYGIYGLGEIVRMVQDKFGVFDTNQSIIDPNSDAYVNPNQSGDTNNSYGGGGDSGGGDIPYREEYGGWGGENSDSGIPYREEYGGYGSDGSGYGNSDYSNGEPDEGWWWAPRGKDEEEEEE